MFTKEQLNALACAIAVLEGVAGGYSPEEKQRAKEVLWRMFSEHLADVKP